ncbi:MAG TPA: glycerophosphodiester phosphodiesterase [Clostridia bacterium]|nr:glycerophosphodiester phosphodiesterase [Clostridia bacterium]
MRKIIFWSVCSLIIISVAVISAIGFVCSDAANRIPPLSENFTITAHTGCEKTPENSLESIVKGIASGANVVEFDIRFLEDGTPVLCHDEDEKSYSSVTAPAALALLAQYSCKVNLDLKETSHLENLAYFVELYDLGDRCFFTGVSADMVDDVKEKAPEIPYYLNIKVPLTKKHNLAYAKKLGSQALDAGAIGVNLNYKGVTKENVSVWKDMGLLVSVYTLNRAMDINLALYKGVDNITTLKPSLAKKIIGKL